MARLVALCVMSDHFCAPLAYLNAKNDVLNADLSIPEAWYLGLIWLLLSSSRKQALEDQSLYGTHAHDEEACSLKKPFEKLSSHREDKV